MRRYCLVVFVFIFSVSNAFSIGHHNGKGHNSPFYVMPADIVHKDTAKKDSIKTDSVEVKHKEFAFGLEGANDQSNHGLHNGNTKLPYLEPSFTYTAKSGFYVEVDDQYLISSKQIPKNRAGFDVFGIDPGWDWDISDNTTLNGNITYNSYKKRTPNLIKSNLEWTPEAYWDQYIVGELESKLTIDYDIYKAVKNQPATPNDVVITPDLLCTFEWDLSKKNSISFIPEANIEFGTRNFYTQYLNNKVTDSISNNYKPKKQAYSSSSNTSFGTLDYNLMLSIEFKLGKFEIEPEIIYSYPLYSPTGLSNPPAVYGTITLTYTIKSKK